MSKIIITYSNQHQETLDSQDYPGQDLQAVADSRVKAYKEENPSVYGHRFEYQNDDLPEPAKTLEEAQARVDESLSRRKHEIFKYEKVDNDHLANKLLRFYGARYFVEKAIPANEPDREGRIEAELAQIPEFEREGIAKGLNSLEFKAWLHLYDIEMMLNQLKPYGFSLDKPISEVDYDHLKNALANMGKFANKDDTTGRYKSVTYLRDTIVVSLSESELVAVLRGVVLERTGKLFNNNDTLDEIVRYWTKLTGNPDPRIPTDKEIEVLKSKIKAQFPDPLPEEEHGVEIEDPDVV